MNPLFGKGGYGMGDVIRIFKQAKQNPAMVSNLLVVLCADEAAQPVVNTGTLHQ